MKQLAALFLVCAGATLSAQSLYKWVDAQGKVSYSDQPPPPSMQVKDLSNTVNTLGAGQAQNETLDFNTQQRVNQTPVVLYTSKGCAPCDQGRALLRGKNVPYTEKTVDTNADLKALEAQFKSQTLPVLALGQQSVNGFGASQWSEALATAGYSDATTLPKTYANGVVSPLTAPSKATTKASTDAAATATPRKRTESATRPATPAAEPMIKF
jgi:glutaredoxin